MPLNMVEEEVSADHSYSLPWAVKAYYHQATKWLLEQTKAT